MSDSISAGNNYTGKIDGVAAFGVFVELPNKQKGLLHVSVIPNNQKDNLRDNFKVGAALDVHVVSIDKDRIKLELAANH